MIKSKKGISPLIATVLLIGFTVALAAIVMTWGTKFTRDVQKTTSESATSNVACAQDVMLSIIGVCQDKTADPSGKTYKIVVSNEGKTDITALNIRLYKSSTDVDSAVSNEQIAKFATKSILAATTTAGYEGQIRRADIIPTIKIGGDTITCQANVESYGEAEDIAAFKVC